MFVVVDSTRMFYTGLPNESSAKYMFRFPIIDYK
jgi:hypothetical protein